MAKESLSSGADGLPLREKIVPGPTNALSPAISMLPVANPTDSFWHTELHKLNDCRTTDELPALCDVLIIGAGYAGVATAYNLVKGDTPLHTPIPSIAILEARFACSGATGRNGGHVRPDLYGHIPTYIERHGVKVAAKLAEFEIAHVQAIKKLIAKEKLDCDFTLTRTVEVWTNQAAADKAKAVYDMMVAHSLAYMDDVDFTYGKLAEGVSGIKNAKATASYTAGTIWPYKFILQLLDKVLATGTTNLQTHTPVLSVAPSPSGGFFVQTPRGSIHAKQVIHASNAYVSGLLPEYSANIVPCKGVCCRITVPEGTIAPLVDKSYIIRSEDGEGLDYLIPRADGSIVVGGASQTFRDALDQWYNNVDDSSLIKNNGDYYQNYMQRTFRGWDNSGAKIDKMWTGIMGYSYDSNPHVGHVPSKPGQLVIAGFNGHGMPVIWLAAKGLAEMIRTSKSFEETGMPILLKTTAERLEKAKSGGPEGGDILAFINQK